MTELKKTPDMIVFTPVADWTINRAIAYSIDTAKSTKKPVQVDINDIVLTVTEKSGLSEVKNLYLKLLNEKYSMKK